jgi:hypothetical protein
MRPGWLRPVAVAIVVVLIAGAGVFLGKGKLFGSGNAAVGALDLVHASAGKTSAAGTSKFELSMTVQDGSDTQTATGSGAFDYAHQSGALTLTVPGEGAVSMLFIDKVIYMQMPADAMKMFGGSVGASWFKMDLSQLPSGATSGSVPDQLFGNPSQFLQALLSATGAKKVGTETVRGVSTTHYSADVSIAELAKAMSVNASAPDDVLGAGTAHIEVWLDKSGLTRRLRTTFSAPKLGTASMSIEFFDFGSPVRITPPPSNQVLDFGQIVRRFTSTATPQPSGTAPGSLAISQADADVKSDLRQLADDEEVYFTDYMHYATTTQLACTCKLSLHRGDTFVFHINRPNNFCIAGFTAATPEHVWVYASDQGGVATSAATHDTCSSARYPTYGGHIYV